MIKKNECLILLMLLLISTSVAYSQKLPTIQQGSVYAPATIKIDGKTTEWGNKFQAYNKATSVFYTIANDNSNLYLIIQATKPEIIEKIVFGGITLTVNKVKDKKSKENIAITFPKYENGDSYRLNLKSKPEVVPDSQRYKASIDSFARVLNNQMASKAKLIEVEGIKEIDSTISVYNEEKIKVVALFDGQLNYTYELAIPLNYLKLNINSPIKFSYNVKLNGQTANHSTLIMSGLGRSVVVVDAAGHYIDAIPATPQLIASAFPTDFSGEYTLVTQH